MAPRDAASYPRAEGIKALVPAEHGGFRSECFLTKAFAEVGRLIGLKKNFTPRGMRRTFNDLARVANVEAIVTKSIPGHLTEQMRERYSTVSPVEQRESIGRLLRLVKGGAGELAVLSNAPAERGTPRGTQDPLRGTHSTAAST